MKQRESLLDRRAFLGALGLLADVRIAEAQQPPTRSSRIGLLWTSSATGVSAYRDAFREGLRQLGYVEGRDVIVDDRHADDRLEALPGLARQIVRSGVDAIVTQGTPATRAAKQATGTIPIVMFNVGDPVRSNLVASLSRPGGNVTGITNVVPEITAKRLGLLKEAIPHASRVAVLWDSAAEASWSPNETLEATRSLGLQPQPLKVRGPEDLEAAFAAAKRHRAEAMLVLPSPVLNYQRRRLVDLAARHRLATSYQAKEFVDAGGLMSYGPHLPDIARRAAAYVDRILKGAKPADLPVEQPTKFELVINLKTAKALGLTIPPSLLQRADQVIE